MNDSMPSRIDEQTRLSSRNTRIRPIATSRISDPNMSGSFRGARPTVRAAGAPRLELVDLGPHQHAGGPGEEEHLPLGEPEFHLRRPLEEMDVALVEIL